MTHRARCAQSWDTAADGEFGAIARDVSWSRSNASLVVPQYAAHDVGGPWMSRGGLLAAVGGLTGMVAAALDASEGWVFGLVMAGTIPMVVMLITSTVLGARAARRIP